MTSKIIPGFLIRSSCGKQLKCTICDCWLPSSAEKFVQSHLGGRKHKQKLHRKSKREEILKCSVYVKGFDPHIDQLEEQLKLYFEDLSVVVTDVYVDKNTAGYSIVQFENGHSVEKVLNSDHKLFHGKKLVIRQREPTNEKEINQNVAQSDVFLASDPISCMLPDELQTVLSQIKYVPAQITAIQQYYELSEADLEVRTLLCELLRNVLEEVLPSCQVKLFGSSANGLGVKECDVDMTLLTPEQNDKEEELMSEVREIIQRFAPGCKNVSIVQSAKTCSIVKFYHTDSKLNVDLSLNNRLALRNTKLIHTYVEYGKSVQSLIYTIRVWAKCYNLTGRSSLQITNYALTMMIIHYLQQQEPPVLPCLQESCSGEESLIGHWNCAFAENLAFTSMNTLNVGELLNGFFDYFINFAFGVNGIAVHATKRMTRNDCLTSACKVDEMGTQLKVDTAILVQDPFKLSHNVAQNLSEAGLKLLLDMMNKAKHSLELASADIITLFTPEKKVKTRTKQKKKRNRSNVYSITLPNCRHVTGKETPCCYEFAKSVILNDLNMKVANDTYTIDSQIDKSPMEIKKAEPDSPEERCVSVNSPQRECDVEVPSQFDVIKLETVSNKGEKNHTDADQVEINHTDADKGDSVNTDNRKRKCDEDVIMYKPMSKKVKSDYEKISSKSLRETECLELTVSAFVDTWTNRRKHRRQLQQSNNSENDECKKEGVKEFDTSSNVVSEEIFTFKLNIRKASSEQDVCKLTVEPLNSTKNMLQFQTFYAYFKKGLISTFK